MSRVRPSVPAGTRLRHSLLIARKLNKLAQLVLREGLEHLPKVLDVGVRLHQSHLVHSVGLKTHPMNVQDVMNHASGQNKCFNGPVDTCRSILV